MLSLLLPRVPTDRAKSMIDDHDAWTRCKFLSSIHCEVLRRVSPSLDLSVRQLILAYALINATGIMPLDSHMLDYTKGRWPLVC